MIIFIDDDTEIVPILVKQLEASGLESTWYSDPHKALDALEASEPSLIISDVMMPEIDGFEFCTLYRKKFPKRKTPFVFLSGCGDEESVLRGLDDADDYITKPVTASVLIAKVKAILRRCRPGAESVFLGDFSQISLVHLLQFCEKRGLTGTLEIVTSSLSATITFSAGELQLDSSSEALLTELMDIDSGTFVIKSNPIDFDEIAKSALPDCPEDITKGELIAGRLSSVQFSDRIFQLQTEHDVDAEEIITIVTLNGCFVARTVTEVPDDAGPEEIKSVIKRQHSLVEERVESISSEHTDTTCDEEERDHFIEEGLVAYRSGHYQKALSTLERAVSLFPDDKLLRANLGIVRRKLSNL